VHLEGYKTELNIDVCFLAFLFFNWQVNRDTSLGEIIFCELGKNHSACFTVDAWKIHHLSICCLFFIMKFIGNTEKI
jgi:hypothetical protein